MLVLVVPGYLLFKNELDGFFAKLTNLFSIIKIKISFFKKCIKMHEKIKLLAALLHSHRKFNYRETFRKEHSFISVKYVVGFNKQEHELR